MIRTFNEQPVKDPILRACCRVNKHGDPIFLLHFYNVTEWLASPGGTKFSKPIEEMWKEDLNVFLHRGFNTSARKKDGTLSVSKSSTVKSKFLLAQYLYLVSRSR